MFNFFERKVNFFLPNSKKKVILIDKRSFDIFISEIIVFNQS